jgi:hypothetical protein
MLLYRWFEGLIPFWPSNNKSHLRKDNSFMDSHTLAEFTHRIAGEVVVPGSQAYDDLRNVFNRAGSPAVIVRGHSNDDIMTALRFAR